MRWTRKLLFLGIIWSVALVVLLVATEILLRLTADDWSPTVRMNIVRNRTYEFDVSSLYDTPDPVVRYSRNRWGLRDDCASPADIDILTMGGSTTDQRFIPFASTWQKVMEDDLSRSTGKRLCVSNAGVDGQSTHGHLRAFERWLPLIPGLRPRIILFYIGINDVDFTLAGPNGFDDDDTNGIRLWLKELEVTQLWFWMSDVIGSVAQVEKGRMGHHRQRFAPQDYVFDTMTPGAAAQARAGAERFRQRLRKLIAESRRYGAEVICVTQPHRRMQVKDGRPYGIRNAMGGPGSPPYNGLDYDYSLRQLNAVMREECGDGGFIDLYRQPFTDSQFYDFSHTNPQGSRRIGHILADRIARSGRMADFAGMAIR